MRSYRDFFFCRLVVLLGKSMKVGFPKPASFTCRVTEEHANLCVKESKIWQIKYNLKEIYCYYVSNSVCIPELSTNLTCFFRNEVYFNLTVCF